MELISFGSRLDIHFVGFARQALPRPWTRTFFPSSERLSACGSECLKSAHTFPRGWKGRGVTFSRRHQAKRGPARAPQTVLVRFCVLDHQQELDLYHEAKSFVGLERRVVHDSQTKASYWDVLSPGSPVKLFPSTDLLKVPRISTRIACPSPLSDGGCRSLLQWLPYMQTRSFSALDRPITLRNSI